MKLANPLISVIVPTFNSEKYIESTLKSILIQTYSYLEILIIDDCSTDSTSAIINKIAQQDNRINIELLKVNSGVAIARNKGIEKAKGHYIAFLDSDDLWLPHKIETQLSFFQEHNCDVVFSSYYCIDESGKSLNKTVEALKKLNLEKLLKCNYIGNLTGIYSVTNLGKIYAPNLRKRQDWGLWISAIKKAKYAYGIPEPLAKYRVRSTSMSASKWDLITYNFKIYRVFLRFSYFKSVIYLLRFFYEYFVIKKKQTITDNTN